MAGIDGGQGRLWRTLDSLMAVTEHRETNLKSAMFAVVSFLSDGSQLGLWSRTVEPELSFCLYSPSHLDLFQFVHPYGGAVIQFRTNPPQHQLSVRMIRRN